MFKFKISLFFAVLFLIASKIPSYANTFSLPDNDEIDKIVRVCAMGSSQETLIEGELAVKLWRKKVEGEGKLRQSDVGAILETVKNTQNFENIVPQYYDCVEKRLNQYLTLETLEEKQTADPIGQDDGNTIVFKNPACAKAGKTKYCYVEAIAQDKDTEICVSKHETKLISDGVDISNHGMNSPKLNISGNRSSNYEINIDLPKDIAIRIGVNVSENWSNDVEFISLLNIETCDGQNIRVKNFPVNPGDFDIYYVEG